MKETTLNALRVLTTNLFGNDGYEPIVNLEEDEFGALENGEDEFGSYRPKSCCQFRKKISAIRNILTIRKILIIGATFIIVVVFSVFAVNGFTNSAKSHPNMVNTALASPSDETAKALNRLISMSLEESSNALTDEETRKGIDLVTANDSKVLDMERLFTEEAAVTKQLEDPERQEKDEKQKSMIKRIKNSTTQLQEQPEQREIMVNEQINKMRDQQKEAQA